MDTPIPCDVREGDGVEISLAENLVRLPMHPADQFDAFKSLADQGKGPEEIAARFGCSPTLIRQRLKLAGVSAALLDAYRKGAMDLDQLMAFTVSDDHAAQEKLWAELPEWDRHPSTIRRLLTLAHVEARDRRARFVGIDAYIAAGGNVLAGNPEIALAAVVHALVLPLLYGYGTDSCLAIRVDRSDLRASADSIKDAAAAHAFKTRHDEWCRRLPERAEDLWGWLLREDATVRLDLLAFCAGCAVDSVVRPRDGASSGRLAHADHLAAALSLDMAQWWEASASSYLGHVSKARILEAVAEGVSPQAAENLAKLKKGALVALAQERLAGTGWLPAILRGPIGTVSPS